ncbi:V8-like Glu-specific endopeptidase [Bradyrhizobium sp. RT6a]|uniref:trypsin-like serine peptidase n=1 Tax=unclassified Bradyrhizobium TaxID=2631580 RepID=UPI00339B5995
MLRKAFVVVGVLLASGPPVAAQRMENGNVRPVSDGIVQEVSMMLQPQSGQPQSAKMSVDSAGAKSIRIRINLAKNATPRTDYIVAVRDRNGGLVARYPAAELRVKQEVWSPPVPGASVEVEVEVETAAADTVGIAIAVTGIIAQRTPGDPMLSVLGETFDLEPMEAFRLEKPEIFKAGLAVAKLMFVRDGKSLACTGFMIDDDRMLTNEHCINSQAVCESAVALFGYDSNASMTSEMVRDQSSACLEFQSMDEKLDVAMVRLANSPGKRWGRLKLAAATPDELSIVIHHPNGDPKYVTREDCFVVKLPVDGRAKDTDFSHLCDTMGGSSGSPVLSRRSLEVIGLHHFGIDLADPDWRDQNRAVRMELIRTKLGL